MAWLDKLVVFLALGLSLAYAVFSLGPRALRARIAAVLGRTAPRTPRALGLQRGVAKLAAVAAAKAKGGGCNDCASNPAVARIPSSAAKAPGVEGEVRVPLSRIPRRRGSGG
jgi:hypothetical protein